MDAFTFRPIPLRCMRCQRTFVWTPEAQAAQLARDARMDPPGKCFPCRGGQKRGPGSRRQPSSGLAAGYKRRS